MIVCGMEILDMDDIGRGVFIEHRNSQHGFANPVTPGNRPAIVAQHRGHPLGPQREQFGRIARAVLHHLNPGIAVEQQLRRQRFEQGLPGARRAHQRQQRRIGIAQGRLTDPFRHQPHRALRHRIFNIGAAHRGLIIERLPCRKGISENPWA